MAHSTAEAAETGVRVLLHSRDMLLLPLGTQDSPPDKGYPALNVNSAEVEKL